LNLGMFQQAFELLDDLPEPERSQPRALHALMFYAFREHAYQAAEKLALRLAGEELPFRVSAGIVLHELAKIYWHSGHCHRARSLAWVAINADPHQKDRIARDPELPADLLFQSCDAV
jgi:hypothetical protein